jgi:hypothetical protein
MTERHVIVIELAGLLIAVGALVYALGVVTAAVFFVGVSLVVTAQIVRTR